MCPGISKGGAKNLVFFFIFNIHGVRGVGGGGEGSRGKIQECAKICRCLLEFKKCVLCRNFHVEFSLLFFSPFQF